MVSRPTLPPFILNPLCKLFALLTKVGWLEKDPQTEILHFQTPIKDIVILAKNANNEGLLALKLLNALVEEANSVILNYENNLYFIKLTQDEGLDSISKQRKISADFRDNRLLDIFILSLDILKEACDKQQLINDSQVNLNHNEY